MKKIKIITFILIVILVTMVAFFGVYIHTQNRMEDKVKGYSYAMDLEGSRVIRLKLDTGTKTVEEFAKEMFTAGSNLKGKTIEVIFYQDFKRFTSDKVNFGVGQISSMNSDELKDLKKRLLPVMKHECGKNGISMVFFMLTNILEESSEILCYGEGSERLVRESFDVQEEKGRYVLPGVVSRKKQLIPAFIGTLQQSNS